MLANTICYANSYEPDWQEGSQPLSVYMQLATQIVASLLALEAANENQDIQLYINSQGKPVTGFVLLWRQSHAFLYKQKVSTAFAGIIQVCHAGGSPYATIAILDIMDAIKCDISTVAFGMCASTATLLLVRTGMYQQLVPTRSRTRFFLFVLQSTPAVAPVPLSRCQTPECLLQCYPAACPSPTA